MKREKGDIERKIVVGNNLLFCAFDSFRVRLGRFLFRLTPSPYFSPLSPPLPRTSYWRCRVSGYPIAAAAYPVFVAKPRMACACACVANVLCVANQKVFSLLFLKHKIRTVEPQFCVGVAYIGVARQFFSGGGQVWKPHRGGREGFWGKHAPSSLGGPPRRAARKILPI